MQHWGRYTNSVMNIYNSSKSNGASNVQWSNTGASNEQWQISAISSTGITVQSLYTIKNKNSGLILDIKADSKGDFTSDNNQCVQNNSTGAANQKWLIETATPWSQAEFEIGSWVGPLFTLATDPSGIKQNLKDYQAANFNTIIYQNNGNPVFTNTTFMSTNPGAIKLSNTSLPPFFDYDNMVNNSSSVMPLPMEDCLSLLKSVGGVKLLIWNGYTQDPNSIMYDYYSLKYGWPVNSDLQCAQDVINTATVYKNFSQYRAQMMGYFIGDEPNYGDINQINRVKLINDNLAASDPGMIGFVNSLACCNSMTDWNFYANYVDSWIASPNTKVVTFDYYVFETANNPANGYLIWPPLWPNPSNQNFNNTTPTYFKTLNLFATSIQNHGNKVNFWGDFGASCDEGSTDGGTGNYYYHPTPNEQMLRYDASINLIYGSKGMNWYRYIPDGVTQINAPSNNSSIYNAVQKINGELKTMGPVLLGLNWIRTVHGARTDPCTGEPGLVTGDMSDNIIAMIGQMAPYNGQHPSNGQMIDYMAIGELQPVSGDQSVKYLIIMNKWLKYKGSNTYSGSSTDFYYTAVGTNKKISQFNKSTGAWTSLSTTSGQGTTFELVVAPGDVQLIRITN